MHAYEQTSSKVHSGYALSTRSTDTAKVEGLWLVNGPKCLVHQDTQMTVTTAPRFGRALLL